MIFSWKDKLKVTNALHQCKICLNATITRLPSDIREGSAREMLKQARELIEKAELKIDNEFEPLTN